MFDRTIALCVIGLYLSEADKSYAQGSDIRRTGIDLL